MAVAELSGYVAFDNQMDGWMRFTLIDFQFHFSNVFFERLDEINNVWSAEITLSFEFCFSLFLPDAQ